jgi:hypothetical protein
VSDAKRGVGCQPSQSRRLIGRFRSMIRLRPVGWQLGCGAEWLWSAFAMTTVLLISSIESVRTSLEPRPKPDTTLPFMRRGKGVSGPLSGPMIFGRGPSGCMMENIFQALIQELEA